MPVDPHLFLAYLVAAWVLILTPGPDMMFVLGQTLAGGPRQGWAATFGVFAGAACHILAAAFGVAAVVAASPGLFDTLRLAGAAYLIWIGLGALRGAVRRGESGGGGGTAVAPRPAVPTRRAFLQGMVTNLLNPKVLLFYLAFLPQFVDPGRSPAWLQMLILGPLLPLMAVPVFAALIAGAHGAAARLARGSGGTATRWLGGTAGVLFLGLGLRLLFEQAPPPTPR